MPRNLAMDFLQGASNAAASNVSGPIDLLAFALRKIGFPVPEDPVLGAKWMADRGITAQPQNKVAGMLGETAGLVAPIAAAAKAPEIAANLVKHGEQFQAYNRALGPVGASQATVWHGGPHKFDRFDSSKIGTGEGVQAYGHGLYLAESPDVAGQYAKQMTAPANDGPQNHAAMIANSFKGDMGKALEFAKSAQAKAGPEDAPHFAEVVARLSREPQLYKVDLPDPLIARMLDWDKPLSQQAPEVQKAIRAQMPDAAWNVMKNRRGQDYVEHYWNAGIGGSGQSAMAGAEMRKLGIPGIRFLDSGSRSAGTGTSNYVVFPGEESALTILERNGQRLSDLGKK